MKESGERRDHHAGDAGALSSLFRLGVATPADNAAALTTAIDHLIHEGLETKLDRDPPVIGDTEVTLEIKPGLPARRGRR